MGLRELNFQGLALLAIAAFIFALGCRRQNTRMKTIRDENRINVTIDKISCSSRKSNVIVKYRDQNQIINVGYLACTKFNVGQKIEAYYNEDLDVCLIKDERKNQDNVQAMWAGGGLALLTLLYYFYQYRKVKILQKK